LVYDGDVCASSYTESLGFSLVFEHFDDNAQDLGESHTSWLPASLSPAYHSTVEKTYTVDIFFLVLLTRHEISHQIRLSTGSFMRPRTKRFYPAMSLLSFMHLHVRWTRLYY